MVTGIGEVWPSRQMLMTQRLRQRRADLGLTQQQVVTRLTRQGVHTTNRALSNLERGAGIDVAKLPELAEALDCTVTFLVGLTDDPHRWEPDSQLSQPRRYGGGTPERRTHPWILGLNVPERASGPIGGPADQR